MNIITKLLSRYQERRDKKFRERIVRVYFHVDEHGNRFIKGSLYAVKDEEPGASGILCANLDDTLQKVQCEWGQSFDGKAPLYTEGYCSAIGSNNPCRQEESKD